MHFYWNMVTGLHWRVGPGRIVIDPLFVSLKGQRLEVLNALLGIFLRSNKHLLALLFHFFELKLFLLDRVSHVLEPRSDLAILLP